MTALEDVDGHHQSLGAPVDRGVGDLGVHEPVDLAKTLDPPDVVLEHILLVRPRIGEEREEPFLARLHHLPDLLLRQIPIHGDADLFDLELLPLGHAEKDADRSVRLFLEGGIDGRIIEPLVLADLEHLARRFLELLLLEKGPLLDRDGRLEVGGFHLLVPLDGDRGDDRLLGDEHRETQAPGSLLRIDPHVGEIPHPVDRLHILPDPDGVELPPHAGLEDPEDRVVPYPSRPFHADLQNVEAGRNGGRGMDHRDRQEDRETQEGRSQAGQ